MRIATPLTWAAVIIWAIWVGGQTYHAMMIVPMWSLDPPASLERFSELGRGTRGVPFFLVFSTVWTFILATVASFTSPSLPWSERRWLVIFAFAALTISVVLIVWLAPTIGGLFARQYTSPTEAAQTFRRWERANLVRLWLEFGVLLVALRCLIAVGRPTQGTAPR